MLDNLFSRLGFTLIVGVITAVMVRCIYSTSSNMTQVQKIILFFIGGFMLFLFVLADEAMNLADEENLKGGIGK